MLPISEKEQVVRDTGGNDNNESVEENDHVPMKQDSSDQSEDASS